MNRFVSLLIFLTMVLVAVVISGQFVGGQWYQSMQQPGWNPSALVMAMVWAVVYVLMALSGWVAWENRRSPAMVAMTFWFLQLLLCILWSWFYFGLGRVGWALGVMTLWVVASLIVINAFRSIKPLASLLMLPVVAWLLFSWALNFTQWSLNGGGIG